MESFWLVWNVHPYFITLFYVTLVISVLVFGIGLWHRMNLWRQAGEMVGGKASSLSRLELSRLAIRQMFSFECLTARRVFVRSRWRGVILLLIMVTFLMLVANLLINAFETYSPVSLLRGSATYVLSFMSETAGAIFLLSICLMILRRYVFKPRKLVTEARDGIMLLVFFLLAFSGFLLEGARLAVLGNSLPIESVYFGEIFTRFYEIVGWEKDSIGSIHPWLWLLHTLTASFMVAYLPYSKLFHMITAQIVTYSATKRQRRSTGSPLTDKFVKEISRDL